MASAFRNALEFFNEIGIYDVVLPFLLIFTIVFAILEKTKLFGYEDTEKKYTRKNLNSMVAFVIAFLVVASTRIVAIISQTISHVVLLLLLGIFFMILIGVFLGDKELKFSRDDRWFVFWSVFMLIGIFLIFLNAIKTENGTSWLELGWNWIASHWSSSFLGALILILIVVGFMYYIITPYKPKEEKKKKEEE
ncbi:hypothetical protein KY308_03300 [Candidatus Woesearchaeota archaeon]|nr:hypothetical protein [Candidatus Woesearchaeota archaeon]